MATAASATAKSPIERERAFFFYMALAMCGVIVAGFSTNLLLGRSSFVMPLIIHVHAFVYFGWVVLYLLQSGLVVTGNIALHKRLGWLSLAWLPAMLGLGMAVTLHSVRATGGPPFFDTNEFLIGNPMGLVAFAGTVIAALLLRRRPDWHRRLMCAAMASLTGPGFGRLLPMPFLIPWGWWIAAVAVPLIFGLVGILHDRRRHGAVHPAWLWGFGALIASQLVADAIAYSPIGYALTEAVVAGTPGADRDPRAHLPPGMILP